MKIYHILDPQAYSQLTVHQAIINLAKKWGMERIPLTIDDMKAKKLQYDQSECLFVAESALIKLSLITTGFIKDKLPNSKIIALGSDTIWYMKGGDHGHHPDPLYDKPNNTEFQSLKDVDLFLDLLDEVIETYRSQPDKFPVKNVDYWMWTASDTLLNFYLNKPRPNLIPKETDFIGLFVLHYNNQYRFNLLSWINEKGYTIKRTGCVNYDLNALYKAYSTCRFNLGTTSPSWTSGCRTMKGFRDWISPACGTVLIYDNHPDIIRKYNTCPLYDYNNFDSITECINNINYDDVLDRQVTWIKENTIEKQFDKLFRKHQLI